MLPVTVHVRTFCGLVSIIITLILLEQHVLFLGSLIPWSVPQCTRIPAEKNFCNQIPVHVLEKETVLLEHKRIYAHPHIISTNYHHYSLLSSSRAHYYSNSVIYVIKVPYIRTFRTLYCESTIL